MVTMQGRRWRSMTPGQRVKHVLLDLGLETVSGAIWPAAALKALRRRRTWKGLLVNVLIRTVTLSIKQTTTEEFLAEHPELKDDPRLGGRAPDTPMGIRFDLGLRRDG